MISYSLSLPSLSPSSSARRFLMNSLRTSNSVRVRGALWPLLVGRRLPWRANHSSQKHSSTNCRTRWKMHAKLPCSCAALGSPLLRKTAGGARSVSWRSSRSSLA